MPLRPLPLNLNRKLSCKRSIYMINPSSSIHNNIKRDSQYSVFVTRLPLCRSYKDFEANEKLYHTSTQNNNYDQHKSYPLGSMKVSDWKECMDNMIYTLKPINNKKQEQQQQNNDSNEKNEINNILRNIKPRQIDDMNHILKRMIQEYETQSIASRIFNNNNPNSLESWLIISLQAWIQICNQNPMSIITINRAYEVWIELSRWDKNYYNLHPKLCIELINVCLQIQKPKCTILACNLLIDNSIKILSGIEMINNNEILKINLIDYHHKTLSQLIKFITISDNHSIPNDNKNLINYVELLIKHMNQLSNDFGIEEIQPNPLQIDQIVPFFKIENEKRITNQEDKIYVEPTITSTNEYELNSEPTLSSFDANISLQEKIRNKINSLSHESDREDVKILIKQYTSTLSTNDNDVEFIQLGFCVFDFYIRIQDHVNANVSINQVDQIISKTNNSLSNFNVLLVEKQFDLLHLCMNLSTINDNTGSTTTKNKNIRKTESVWNITRLFNKIIKHYNMNNIPFDDKLNHYFIDVATLWQNSGDRKSVNQIISLLKNSKTTNSFKLLSIFMKTYVHIFEQGNPAIAYGDQQVICLLEVMQLLSEQYWFDLTASEQNIIVEDVVNILFFMKEYLPKTRYQDFVTTLLHHSSGECATLIKNLENTKKVFTKSLPNIEQTIKEDKLNIEPTVSLFESKSLQESARNNTKSVLLESSGESVSTLIEQYTTISKNDEEATMQLGFCAFDFYIKIQDHVNATIWINKLDQIILKTNNLPNLNTKLIEKQFDLLKLWVNLSSIKDDTQSTSNEDNIISRKSLASKADDLLKKIIGQYNINNIPSDDKLNRAYCDVATLWQNSETVKSPERIMSLLKQSNIFSFSLLSIFMKSFIHQFDEEKVFRKKPKSIIYLTEVMKLSSTHWDNLSIDEQKVFVEDIVKILFCLKNYFPQELYKETVTNLMNNSSSECVQLITDLVKSQNKSKSINIEETTSTYEGELTLERASSSFKSKSLQEKIRNNINSLSLESDRDEIENLIKQYTTKLSTNDNNDEFIQLGFCVFDFYTRIQDSVNANNWLNQLDQIISKTDGMPNFNVMLVEKQFDLLHLWMNLSTTIAESNIKDKKSRIKTLTWKADKLLNKIIKQYNINNISSDDKLICAYCDVATLWQNSDDSRSLENILSLSKNLKIISFTLLSIFIKTYLNFFKERSLHMKKPENIIYFIEVIKLLSIHWDDLSNNKRNIFIEDIVKVMFCIKSHFEYKIYEDTVTKLISHTSTECANSIMNLYRSQMKNYKRVQQTRHSGN